MSEQPGQQGTPGVHEYLGEHRDTQDGNNPHTTGSVDHQNWQKPGSDLQSGSIQQQPGSVQQYPGSAQQQPGSAQQPVSIEQQPGSAQQMPMYTYPTTWNQPTPGSWLATLHTAAVLEIQMTKGFPGMEFQILDCVSRHIILKAVYDLEWCSCNCGNGREITFTDTNGSTVLQLKGLFRLFNNTTDIMYPPENMAATVSIARSWTSISYDCLDVNSRLLYRVTREGIVNLREIAFNITDANGYVLGKYNHSLMISGSSLQFFLPLAPEAKTIIVAFISFVMMTTRVRRR